MWKFLASSKNCSSLGASKIGNLSTIPGMITIKVIGHDDDVGKDHKNNNGGENDNNNNNEGCIGVGGGSGGAILFYSNCIGGECWC